MNRQNTGCRDAEYTDVTKSPAERAQALLKEMTLDEKMAQLGCVFPFGCMDIR